MVTLVIGGADSGKSEYAERLLLSQWENSGGRLVYFATMEPTMEAKERIERHKKRREGLEFYTLEKNRDISSVSGLVDTSVIFEDVPNFVANEMFAGEDMVESTDRAAGGSDDFGDGENTDKYSVIGVNSDISKKTDKTPGKVEDTDTGRSWDDAEIMGLKLPKIKKRIEDGLMRLVDSCDNICFVTGDIASSGDDYGKLTIFYMKLLGHVNRFIARHSDQVIEVVAGLPNPIRR